MNNICIIPARGGSKRIPRKNIKLFLGKPIITYSIETAIRSGLFNKIIVSTDDPEIAETSKKYGASVPFMRSKANSDDYAGTMDVLSEVIENFKKEKKTFNYICCIYPTAPLIQIKHLNEGYQLIQNQDFNTVFPVVAFPSPIWRGLKRNKNGITSMVWPENQNKRSQDLEKVYHDSGQWYWLKYEAIGRPIFNDKSASIVLSDMEVQDIDNPNDWKIAEIKYEQLQGLESTGL